MERFCAGRDRAAAGEGNWVGAGSITPRERSIRSSPSLGGNTFDQNPNATDLLASFIVNAGGGTLVCIRRTAGLAPPVVIFKNKHGGPEHAISLLELSPQTVRDALEQNAK